MIKKGRNLPIVFLEESPSLLLIVLSVFFPQLWLLYFAGGAARYLVKDDGPRTLVPRQALFTERTHLLLRQ